jgi:hypothetical protein
VLHYKDGAFQAPEILDPAPPRSYGVTALADVADVPTISVRLGVSERGFSQWVHGEWTSLFEAPLAVADPHFIAPLGNGLVYIADGGFIGEYVPMVAPCLVENPIGHDPRFMVALPDGSLLVGVAGAAIVYHLTVQ